MIIHPGIIEHIRKFVDLNDNEEQTLNKYIKSHSYQKKENLLSAGQVCRPLFFVAEGCLRMFFINSKSTDQITQFAIDGWWLTDFYSFMDGKPSKYYIQSVERSRVISIDIRVFDTLLEELPQLERYFRIIFQRNLAASQLRTKLVSDMSKEEFYHHFSTSFPEFVQRVPQYMVASYLGLTPEYVSELRKKK